MVQLEQFKHFDPELPREAAARSLYELLAHMKHEAAARTHPWSGWAAFQDYVSICHWAIRKQEYSFAARHFTALEQSDASLRVLDVGCGVVPLCNWISRRGHHVSAIEPDKEVIDFLTANQLNSFYGSQVEYRHAPCERLPFPDATFDVITCVSVLEHMVPGNDIVAFWEMARVLKPQGRLVLTLDVAPTREPWRYEEPWPRGSRRFAEPHDPFTLEQMFRQISPWFPGASEPLPADLTSLTWDEVHAFWAASQEHDGRSTRFREYLAMGAVLERSPQADLQQPPDIVGTLLAGQDGLIERIAVYQRAAADRLESIGWLQQALAESTAHAKQLKEQLRLARGQTKPSDSS